jgi:hypothetical protein
LREKIHPKAKKMNAGMGQFFFARTCDNLSTLPPKTPETSKSILEKNMAATGL